MNTQSMGGSASSLLCYGRDQIPHDPVDFEEMRDLRLVSRGQGRNAFRLHNNALKLHRAICEAQGTTPVEQVDTAVRTILENPTRLARTHPKVNEHLAAAFELLWSDAFDTRVTISIGGELRAALAQMAADLVGYDTDASPEKAAQALKPWLETDGRLPPRSADLLFAILRAAASGAQRLNHLHDERSNDQPDPGREEVRRVAFAVTFALAEVDACAH